MIYGTFLSTKFREKPFPGLLTTIVDENSTATVPQAFCQLTRGLTSAIWLSVVSLF